MEDINSLLNSGEITGLFPPDDRERILAEFRPWALEQGVEETREALWKAFIGRVRLGGEGCESVWPWPRSLWLYPPSSS